MSPHTQLADYIFTALDCLPAPPHPTSITGQPRPNPPACLPRSACLVHPLALPACFAPSCFAPSACLPASPPSARLLHPISPHQSLRLARPRLPGPAAVAPALPATPVTTDTHLATPPPSRYGMEAAFMLLQRRGRGIHVVSAEPGRAAGRNHQSRECCGNAGAPRAPPSARSAAHDQQKPNAIAFEQHERGIHALRSVTSDAGVTRPAVPTPNPPSSGQSVALTRKIRIPLASQLSAAPRTRPGPAAAASGPGRQERVNLAARASGPGRQGAGGPGRRHAPWPGISWAGSAVPRARTARCWPR